MPPNLDVLIREAFQGGSVKQLKSALDETGEDEPSKPPPRPDRPARDPMKPGAGEVIVPLASAPGFEDDLPTEERSVSEPAAPVEAAPADPAEALLRLWDQADRALQRLREGDLQAVHEALDEVSAAAGAVRAALPDRGSWAVRLPGYQKPFALVIEGLGGTERASELAEALEMDAATARLNAVSHWSRSALRGTDRGHLERLAARVRARGIGAAVLDREALLAVPAALWVIGRLESGRWRVCARAPERADGDAAREAGQLEVEAGGFRLAVQGDVVIRRYRGRSGSRWSRQGDSVQELGERRVSVVDLYGDGPPLRLVVGVTRFEGLPGYAPTSAARSLKNLLDELPKAWIGLRVEGRRVCAPFKTSRLDGEDGIEEVTGWPLWEEHSRSCWLLNEAR